MSLYDIFNDDEDDNFSLIRNFNNPNHVTTVSELRHYVNIWGITTKLQLKFKTDSKTINKIIDGCYGSLIVDELLKNDNYLTEQIKIRKESLNVKAEALYQNELRINELKNKRLTFCGIGTNKIKRRLNILSTNNHIAKIYRFLLETEDKNIMAKDASPLYQDKIYFEKYLLIMNLIKLFEEHNLKFGKQNSDVNKTKYIIYFEAPNCEQISFHCDLPDSDNIPNYDGIWDGLKNSTLIKLECAILKTFPNIINKNFKI